MKLPESNIPAKQMKLPKSNIPAKQMKLPESNIPAKQMKLPKSNIPAKQMKSPENGNIPANICQLYAESKQTKLPEKGNIPAKQMKLPENGNIPANICQLYAESKQTKLPEKGNIPANQLYAEACRGGGRKAVSQAQKPSKAKKTALSLPQSCELNVDVQNGKLQEARKPRRKGRGFASQKNRSQAAQKKLPVNATNSSVEMVAESSTQPTKTTSMSAPLKNRKTKRLGFASRKLKSQLLKQKASFNSAKCGAEGDESKSEFEDVESLSQSMDSFQFQDLIETNPHVKQNMDIAYEPLKHFNGHFSEANIFDLMPYVLLSEILPEDFMAAHYNGDFQGDVSCSLIFPRMFLEDVQIDQREWLTVVGLVFGMVEFLPYFDRNFGFVAARESQDLPAFKSTNISVCRKNNGGSSHQNVSPRRYRAPNPKPRLAVAKR
ncbi:unnamed protein product [Bursaphelenchus xylophilus]|uniref:(pine wood nematode) hypothetical protein n=1 Tax=Bursaphelenchus xylophilus TaxID=6326 RepID=A0A1I7SAV9_BURXY|nr:unnamed protein product [Bursaphelenchus xylophilus]CAG9126722.1 unnamed protein product [Bursaphelenchus xylophilus]